MEVEANTSDNSLRKDVLVEKYVLSTIGLVDGGIAVWPSGGSKARRPRALARAPGQFFCNFLCKFL